MPNWYYARGMRNGGWKFCHPPSGVQHSSVGRGEDEGGGWDGPSSAIRSPAFIRPPWPSRSARDAVARFLETRSDREHRAGRRNPCTLRCCFWNSRSVSDLIVVSGKRLPAILHLPCTVGFSVLVQVWSNFVSGVGGREPF